MGREDYPLEDFVTNIANVEERYANEIMSMVECFYKSRIDLPARRLEEIGKCHLKTSRYLRKVVDPKKSELTNLWKICNTYSVASIEIDNAMRDVRGSIRKLLKKEGMYPKPESSRRLDFLVRKTLISDTGPTESYDIYKPRSLWKVKFPFDFRDRKEKRIITVSNVPTTPNFQPLPKVTKNAVLRPSSLYSTCSSSSEEPKYTTQKIVWEDKVEEKLEQPVPPVRRTKLKLLEQQEQQIEEEYKPYKQQEQQEQPEKTSEPLMNWLTSDSSDQSMQFHLSGSPPRGVYSESFYSDDKNIINVPVHPPRLRTRINIGDTEQHEPSRLVAQTHSIQIHQDRTLAD